MKIKVRNVKRRPVMGGLEVSFVVPEHNAETVDTFLRGFDGDMNVDMTKPRKGRSINANAYLWTLLDKMAIKLNTTDVEVYQTFISRVGVYSRVVVENKAKKSFKRTWENNGIGYLAVEESANEKVTVYRCYAGSHTYDTKQFSRLLDEVISECKALGIETLSPDELAEIKARIE